MDVSKKVVITIPAYNEEKYIGDVVSNSKKHSEHVFVVDDASTDNTQIVSTNAGAKVFRHTVNKRYGGAIRTCFEIARGEKADILVTLDGDGQHDPSDIPKLLGPILKNKADIVIGSRFSASSNHIPFYRKIGISIITFLYNFGSDARVSDSQSGLRAYNSRAIQEMKTLKEDCMGVSVELLLKARMKKLRIREVPTKVYYHNESSSINPIKHGVAVALTVLKLRIFLRGR